MKRIENGLTSKSSEQNATATAVSEAQVRRSARIRLRNIRRKEQAAAAAEQAQVKAEAVGKARAIISEVARGRVATSNAAVSQKRVAEKLAEGPAKMEKEAPPANADAGQDAAVQMAASGQQVGESAGRKRPADNVADNTATEEKRPCYEEGAEPRQEKSTRADSEEAAIARAYQGLPKPIAIRAVPPATYVIRPPVQPPHLPLPQYSMGHGHGAFRLVQPRRMEMEIHPHQQQMQAFDHQYENHLAPPQPPINHQQQQQPQYQWEQLPPAPVMQNLDYFNNNYAGGYAPPEVSEPIQVHYGNRRNGDDSSHSILVQILNSGVANGHVGNSAAEHAMYGGMGYDGFQDPNGNQYGRHQM